MRHRKGSNFPGQYLARNSVLHRLPAGSKLVLASLIALCSLLAARPAVTFALATLCICLYVAARLGRRALGQDLFFVLLHAPLVIAVFVWRDGWDGLHRASLVSSRLALASLPGLWMQRTTRVTDLSASLRRFLPARLAFVVAMSLRFLPLLARDASEIYLLQRLRGARLGARELMNPLRWGEACHCIAVPLLIRTMHLADEVAVAAGQRGLGGATAKSYLEIDRPSPARESGYKRKLYGEES